MSTSGRRVKVLVSYFQPGHTRSFSPPRIPGPLRRLCVAYFDLGATVAIREFGSHDHMKRKKKYGKAIWTALRKTLGVANSNTETGIFVLSTFRRRIDRDILLIGNLLRATLSPIGASVVGPSISPSPLPPLIPLGCPGF